MKKKKLGFVAVLLAALFILAACGGDSHLHGRWISGMIGDASKFVVTYEFLPRGVGIWSDGRGISHGAERHEIPITWNARDDVLEVFFGGQLTANTYYFSLKDDYTLVLRRVEWPEGSEFILTRLED